MGGVRMSGVQTGAERVGARFVCSLERKSDLVLLVNMLAHASGLPYQGRESWAGSHCENQVRTALGCVGMPVVVSLTY